MYMKSNISIMRVLQKSLEKIMKKKNLEEIMAYYITI